MGVAAVGAVAEGVEPKRQVRLASGWLLGAATAHFLSAAMLDLSAVLLEPLLAIALGLAALALAVRGCRVGWELRATMPRAVCAALAAPVAIALLVALTLPIIRLGDYAQAQGTLLFNHSRYRAVIDGRRAPLDQWDHVAGSGADRLWAFGYGGFLSIDRDIVFDPQDRPEPRAIRLLGAQVASCRWLRSHYYDCSLDY